MPDPALMLEDLQMSLLHTQSVHQVGLRDVSTTGFES